jgi:lysozyme family protein
MADFETAVFLTLMNEGGFLVNEITGEVVNFGVTLSFASGCGLCTSGDRDFIKNLTRDQAINIYKTYFWDPHRFGSFADQLLANKGFDLTVNMGPGDVRHDGALTLLQRAVCDIGGDCIIDGIIGDHSIAAINALEPPQLMAAYRARAKARYEEIAEQNPQLAGDLPEWLERLAK